MTPHSSSKFLSHCFAVGFFAATVIGFGMLIAGQDNSLYLAAQ